MRHNVGLPISVILLVVCIMAQIAASVVQSQAGEIEQIVITAKFKEEMAGFQGEVDKRDAGPNNEPFSVKYLLSSEDRFELIAGSMLVDQNGQPLLPDNLKVPCEAAIEYEVLDNGQKNVLSLRVVRPLSPSSGEWAEPLPR